MNWHWKELLPVDRYTVRTGDYLHEMDQKVLTLLYQPLIGAFAYSLYMTLWSELEKDSYWSDENNHRYLMTMMDAPLDLIYQERNKLEAIGLLKTFKKKEDESTVYLYELQPPMSSQAFFNNDVLSVYLYNRLGKNKFRQIRDRFMIEKIDKEEYSAVTRSFDEVFSSLHHSEIVANHQSELMQGLELDKQKEVIQRTAEDDITIENSQFDFDLMLHDLSSFVVTKEMITEEVREAIIRLSFVYRIDPLEMSRILQQSIIHDDEVDLALLRKRVQEWYKIEHGSEPPSLALRKQPLEYQTMIDKEPVTAEEKMIKHFETKSPLELLESRSAGAMVPLPDVKIVEVLLLDFQLPAGVVNVLIDYILTVNDMKLSKPLVDKIAGHWSRKNVKTVKEAMELARLENKKQQEYKQGKEKPKGTWTPKPKNVKKDKLPKWLIEENKKQTIEKKEEKSQKTSKDFAEKKLQFEMMLKQRMEEKQKREE
ncbi:replication initiation and membrane attachment family protein [Bacillus sp. FJAT-45350]|uniref:replication initiation and membrane attachment family protein n=1 Tax=Bacillus sp. FJAT-45350 TaxID=2011014 RepID=UPI000BB78DBE|nr:DnaD domain protein [Bacillus sp. FJAT-45350]